MVRELTRWVWILKREKIIYNYPFLFPRCNSFEALNVVTHGTFLAVGFFSFLGGFIRVAFLFANIGLESPLARNFDLKSFFM